MRYQVIVGNVGTVLDTDNGAAAQVEYGRWKQKSLAAEGRPGGEDVTLMRDGEPWHEYTAPDVVFNHIDHDGSEHAKDWEAYCAEDNFMQPQIEHGRYAAIETDQGTWIIPADVCCSDDPMDYADYVEGEIDEEQVIELKLGWLARLSAPGYMDCSDWSAHDTAREAQQYLMDTYP